MTTDDGDCSAVAEKVIKQIEYYFGDINLMKDKFLKEKIQEDDGWVTIETMLKFNRLKQITEDNKVICDALGKSELMEVNEDNSKIRRNPAKPLPGDTKERRDDLNARSIYAKVFPEDTSLDGLMSFFEKYGPVENIFMRRNFKKKTFKGSVFVLFTEKEDAEKFINEEGTKYKEEEEDLIKKFKVDYYKDKMGEKKKKFGKKDDDKKDEEVQEDEEDEEEKVKQQMTKNAVLHLKGMDPETSREDLKIFFQEFCPVGWVDFDQGTTEGYLRLKEPDSADSTVEKAKAAGDGKIIIKDKEVEVRVVEGEEELDYWRKMFKEISTRNKSKRRDFRQGGGRNFRGGRGGRNRGGGYHGKKRGHERGGDGDEPTQKTAKTD